MGTRADFYIGTGLEAEWLGSVAWDGYQWAEDPDCPLMIATNEAEFIEAIKELSERKDWTSPEQGWPWPWDDSFTTDYCYAFEGDKVTAFNWGKTIPEDEESEGDKICDWPNMADRKNVAWGDRSGVVVMRVKGESNA